MLLPIAARGGGAILVDRDDDAPGRQRRRKVTIMKMGGISFDAKSAMPWVLALALLGGGGALARLAWHRVAAAWDACAGKRAAKGLTV